MSKTASEQILDYLKAEHLVPQKATLEEVASEMPEKVVALIEIMNNRLEIAYDEISAHIDASYSS